MELAFKQDVIYSNIKLPVFFEKYMMEFIHSPNRIWDFEIKNPFKVTSNTSLLKNKKLKFKQIKTQNNSDLTQWKIVSDKNSIFFDAEVYINKKPADQYLKLVNESKASYKTLENLLIDNDK